MTPSGTLALVSALTLAGKLDLSPRPAPTGTDMDIARQRLRDELRGYRFWRDRGDRERARRCIEWALIYREQITDIKAQRAVEASK